MQRDIGILSKVTSNQTKRKTNCCRELQEETSITDAQFVEDFREAIAYFYRRQGLTIHKEVVFFVMESYTDKVELSFEHVGYAWLDYQHAMEKLSFKNC